MNLSNQDILSRKSLRVYPEQYPQHRMPQASSPMDKLDRPLVGVHVLGSDEREC
jgi:hypothetical protein